MHKIEFSHTAYQGGSELHLLQRVTPKRSQSVKQSQLFKIFFFTGSSSYFKTNSKVWIVILFCVPSRDRGMTVPLKVPIRINIRYHNLQPCTDITILFRQQKSQPQYPVMIFEFHFIAQYNIRCIIIFYLPNEVHDIHTLTGCLVVADHLYLKLYLYNILNNKYIHLYLDFYCHWSYCYL